ncbi:EAL and HDOD domain-containing protein [Oceanirhabdus sp. W0125-5]|uniref:EAL and HDOD domain-containing protein n=1 Tax=Oceanirhabdus sp. W0125-5 TaxID=2999116 RepID=UPI0022F2F895|nr:HDOD domain-containing protein [Oceanirhabdus sp. W0125-5]WBW99127.1 HDOD domain-containing protein [Oceanirhabdus sp. W0125-5]
MDVYVARQPIFDKKQKVVSYEMLFRSNKVNCYNGIDGNEATCDVISNTFVSIGIEKLTGGKKAFINFTEELLLNEIPTMLPKEYLVIEILETVEPSKEMLNVCRKLKGLGYTIALDDFVFKPKFQSLLEIVDIIKVDFIQTKGLARKRIVEMLSKYNIKFLAEKVETIADFNEAYNYGYSYFQGYFFSKPEIISEHDIPINNYTNIKVLQMIHNNDFSLKVMEDIIKRDISISYKLLRLINSSYYGFKSEIHSIKQAIIILGLDEIKKWISLIMIKKTCSVKYSELLTRTIVRARLGELIAPFTNLNDLLQDVFLMELLSDLNVILNKPMGEILEDLAINQEIKKALNGENNDLGILHELLMSYQEGNWPKFEIFSQALDISGIDISELYIEALTWTNEFMV